MLNVSPDCTLSVETVRTYLGAFQALFWPLSGPATADGPRRRPFSEPPQLESWGGRQGELTAIDFKPITPLVFALTTQIAVAQVHASAAEVGVFVPEAIS